MSSENFRGRSNGRGRHRNRHRTKGRYRGSIPFGCPPYMKRPMGNDCPILKLNQDCLLKIFSYLSKGDLLNIDKVCPYWNSVADLIWRRFTTFDCTEYFCHYLDKKSLKILIRCGPYIKKIYFPSLIHEDEYARLLNIIACNCPNIEAARLNEFYFLKFTMKNFAKIFKKVKYLEIADEDALMEKTTLKTILRKVPELITLNFGNISTIPRFTFKACFPFYFPTLKELKFGKIEPPADNFFLNLPKYCPNLEVFSISTCLRDVKIDKTIEKLTNLRVLELKDCELSIEKMEEFLCLTNLEQLVLTVAKVMNDDFLTKIVSAMPLLTHLDISGSLYRNLTDKGLGELVKLQHLEFLNLSYHKRITDKGIETIALNGKLRELHLVSTLVTDNVVPKVLDHCHNLKFLDLSACPELTLKVIENLANIFYPGNIQPTLTVILGGNNEVKTFLFDPNKKYDKNLTIKDHTNNVRSRLRKRLQWIDEGGLDELFFDSEDSEDDSEYDDFSDDDYDFSDDDYGFPYDSDGFDEIHWIVDAENDLNFGFWDGFHSDWSDDD